VRNSWGSHWGIDGFFKVIRGINNIAIESDCAWATPVDTWTTPLLHHTTQAEKDDPNNDYTNDNDLNDPVEEDKFLQPSLRGTCMRDPKVLWGDEGEVITRPMSWEEVDPNALPDNWDWRNKDGTNYLSWSTN
jgi:cathepsin X